MRKIDILVDSLPIFSNYGRVPRFGIYSRVSGGRLLVAQSGVRFFRKAIFIEKSMRCECL
jgi:hypothetical protein